LIHNPSYTSDDIFEFLGNTGAFGDREKAFLEAAGYTSGSLDDRWMKYLTALGYTSGSIQDRMYRWFKKTVLVEAARANRTYAIIPQEVGMTIETP
jgi:hypothetical protein